MDRTFLSVERSKRLTKKSQHKSVRFSPLHSNRVSFVVLIQKRVIYPLISTELVVLYYFFFCANQFCETKNREYSIEKLNFLAKSIESIKVDSDEKSV